MIQKVQRKNYYLLQTLREEIQKYEIISFDVFDTAVLRKVLFPQDIFKLLANWVHSRFNIDDFHYIRMNAEQETRTKSCNKEISLDEIYSTIQAKYKDLNIEEIKSKEIALELENTIVNPFIKELFDTAIMLNKIVYFISDMYLPSNIVSEILKKNGYFSYSALYVSSSEMCTKYDSSLFKKILECKQIKVSSWLHIGDNWDSDVMIPRNMGITAAYVRAPRDWFWLEREETHKKLEEENGEVLPWDKLDDSIDFSIRKAKEINQCYTAYKEPCTETVIVSDNVSIMFNITEEKVDNIKEFFIRLLKKQLKFKPFWALAGVSFTVKRGERLGLIGLNGSGKSTMLKVVSGVLKATKGSVKVDGTIAPLIELGAGFDFELSAKENIYLNGAILGYSKSEMDKMYDSIIEFAELKEFENVAIKNFSSGMIARLGFAIATSQKPDILIIDEILAVGDFEFQKKCHRRMQELTDFGTTVLFVSHSAADVIDMCDRAIWLEHGTVIQQGEAQYIVEKYLNKR